MRAFIFSAAQLNEHKTFETHISYRTKTKMDVFGWIYSWNLVLSKATYKTFYNSLFWFLNLIG